MDEEPLWRARLRWRLRGALLWPLFGVLTVVDAVLLGVLPIAGEGGTAFVSGLLLAGALNLVAVALLGRLVARRLRRRRPELPRVVAEDHAGSMLVVGVTVALLVAGLVHRPNVVGEQADLRATERAARQALGPHPLDTIRLGEELFRACVPIARPDRWRCVFVETATSPPQVRRDPGEEPNDRFRGPLGVR